MPRVLMFAGFSLGPLALLLFASGCGNGHATRATGTSPRASTSAPRGPITLTILSPAEGSTVSNPINLQVQAAGIQIAPASQQVAGAAHYHAFLDNDPVAEGQVIPSGAGIYHFTDPVDLRASTGDHKVIVVLGDNSHVRLRGAPTAEVNFTLGE
jgi:hypothetical protein